MIETILANALAILRADEQFLALWVGVKPHLGEKPPYLFPGQAPQSWPKPYLIYSVYENQAAKFGPVRWPMKDFYLCLTAHDYRPSSKRAYDVVERAGHLLTMEMLTAVDPTKATAVRVYENEGPLMVESDAKDDVAWEVTFPVKGYDVGAAETKFRSHS